ncbi:MAG: type IV pilus assembly protein PilM [Parcubacteria group bacterium]|jgi:type IV pilus assembly protein PilM
MFDFNFKKNVFLGIDIGTASVKIVELKIVDGKTILSNYAWMPLGGDILGKNKADADYLQTVLPQCIKKIIKKAKISGRNAYVSLPAFGGLIALIDFPEMADGDMEQAIKFEAHKYVPTSLDEVVISWEIVERGTGAVTEMPQEKDFLGAPSGKNVDSGEKIKVLLVAASRKKVLCYENLIKASGLSLRSIDIETFSIVRSLVGNDLGNFIIVDIGARVCNIILVEKGIIRINRNIDAGGIEMTKTIAKAMGIDFERAEALKVSGRDFFAADSAISFFTLELITGEVERIIRTCHKDGEQNTPDRLILSGGTSKLVGMGKYFSDKLQIEVVIGNPFARISYDSRLEPSISNIQNNFAVAVGLALKGVEEYHKKELVKKVILK